jgi:hypothetical protein
MKTECGECGKEYIDGVEHFCPNVSESPGLTGSTAVLYVATMREEVNKLRKAVQDGIYGTRSIVGDSVIRLEWALTELEKQ